MLLNNSKNIPWVLTLSLCVLALATAYIAEYVFHIPPCSLCLYQRYAYYTVVFLSALAIVTHEPWRKIFSWMILTACAVGFGISLYHFAVENHWITTSRACASLTMTGSSLEEIKQQIMNNNTVPCDQVQWSFLGISMTVYSGLLFLGLLGLSAATIFIEKKITFFLTTLTRDNNDSTSHQ
jgi:disulfide bond formation protein DsbB